MAHITLRLSATWSERLLHRLDVALDRLGKAARDIWADQRGDFREAAHAARVRRLAARGCGGQALI